MRLRRMITLLLAVSLGLGADVAVAVTPSERGASQFAAIAVDRADAAYGYGTNFATRRGAERRALRECRLRATTDGCQGVVWVQDGCAAVAVRQRPSGRVVRLAWGIGRTRDQAKQRARSECQSDGRACRVLTSVCTEQ